MYLIYKQRNKFVIGCILYLVFSVGFTFGQTNPSIKTFEVTSWKKGIDQINPTLFDINFRSEEFYYDVLTVDGKRRLRLNIEKEYIPTLNKRRYQCVVLSLREIILSTIPGGYDLGMNMLINSDRISSLTNFVCPIESPGVFERNIIPFNSVRVFYIENFLVKITPIDFKYDNNYNLLANLNLTVEFSNKSDNAKAVSNYRKQSQPQ